MTTEGQGKRPRLEARLLMKRPLVKDGAQVARAWAAHPTGLPAGTGRSRPCGGVEIGVVASGAHGSRNRADEPCFARGGPTSQTPSNSRIQEIKANARGFRSFYNYRTRILFFCGKLTFFTA